MSDSAAISETSAPSLPAAPPRGARLKESVLNIGLRAITLGSKFVLLLFMARYLSTEALGLYGLMATSVSLSLYFIGFEFHVFNARELIAADRQQLPALLRDQFAFHAVTYLGAFPLLLVLFWVDLLPWKFAPWFFGVLVVEHLSQEAYRVFLALSRPLVANVVLAFRGGLWVYVAVALMWFEPSTRLVTTVWGGWFAGALISLALTAWLLRDLPWRTLRGKRIDWAWIGRGIRGAIPFLGSSLAISGIDSLDRYFIKFFHGESLVGAFSFFATLANAVQVFVFTGVIMILYPKLIGAYQRRAFDEYRTTMKEMRQGVLIGLAVLLTLAAVGVFPVLWLVGKEFFREHLTVYWILLASVAAVCLSMLPHYALYARGADRAIIVSALVAVAVSALCNWLLVPTYGAQGAAASTLAANVAMGLSKVFALKALES